MTTKALETALSDSVAYLCSPACLPRNPGTDGGAAARDYLRDALKSLGLEPAGEYGFDQQIPPIGGTNLLGVIPGTSDRYVMLAAHYDACGPDNPGADDNAAAVAITLEVAAALASTEPTHSIVIALFDAEEPPYFLNPTMGSQWFVDHPTIPLDRLDMMVCLDLVGHALGPVGTPPEIRESVFVLGAEMSSGTGELFDELPKHPGIRARRIDNYIIPSMSDYDAFLHAEVPFLFYSCGRWEHYHMPTDTPDKLDYPKMAALTQHLTDLVAELASRPKAPGFLPEGAADDATVGSLEAVMAPLSGTSPEVAMAEGVVTQLRTSVDTKGELSDAERATVQFLIAQIEEALA